MSDSVLPGGRSSARDDPAPLPPAPASSSVPSLVASVSASTLDDDRIRLKIMNAATAAAAAPDDDDDRGRPGVEGDGAAGISPQQLEKQRRRRASVEEIGASHVDEEAPQLNRRFSAPASSSVPSLVASVSASTPDDDRIRLKSMNAATAAAAAPDDDDDRGRPGVEGDGAVGISPQQLEKQRRRRATVEEIGASHVDEEAPQLNRRFYLGLDRLSVRLRNAQARQARARRRRQGGAIADEGEGDDEEEQGQGQRRSGSGRGRIDGVDDAEREAQRPSQSSERDSSLGSALDAHVSHGHVAETGETLISATLVEDVEPGEVVEAVRIGNLARRWKTVACVVGFLGVALAVVLTMRVSKEVSKIQERKAFAPSGVPSTLPSFVPSSPPSFDPRPTLEIVRERGFVRCGLRNTTVVAHKTPRLKLCRAIAAVLLGDPESFEGVLVTVVNRFQKLRDRAIDVLLDGATHTIEREVRERTTKSGFAFSTPYIYDGMTYFGDKHYVGCAERELRYGDCSSLLVCVLNSTTHDDFLRRIFPSEFLRAVSSWEKMEDMLYNDANSTDHPMNDNCNVIASDQLKLLNVVSSKKSSGRKFVVGDKMVLKDPQAFVTRNGDREFSDVVNWVIQALFYGAEQEITKNSTLCQTYTNSTSTNASDLSFMNAVYCVGNHYEIWGGKRSLMGMNQINDGSSGMIYATPFGELNYDEDDDDLTVVDVTEDQLLNDIRETEILKCGVVSPDGFDEGTTKSISAMSIEYCRTLAAALLYGDFSLVNLTDFSKNTRGAFAALQDGTIDVLAGSRVEWEYDFENYIPVVRGHSSKPSSYGNDTAGATASLVNLTNTSDISFDAMNNGTEAIYINETTNEEFDIIETIDEAISAIETVNEAIVFNESINEAIDGTANDTNDELSEGRVETKDDVESTTFVTGFRFSTPYYYGNEGASEDVSFFSLATREGDEKFSSFVNCVVLATIYAQENRITKKKNKYMPFISLFGGEFKWALKDAISHSGKYDEMYWKNVGIVSKDERGRNVLNEDGGPQIHSFPGLSL